ncbi:cysteine proteinase inhibitor 5-like [Trifolium pratense]|uniref:cysteine proteinase inhibitor 5-like n=1 Tax=Trifolium pratense TaxID=57577 RepID=UPI001E693949|nr:cysteine proteinase inhibitor 5-like [Trifolium pratense]
MMKFESLVPFLLVLLVSMARNEAIAGGYHPIKNINDPYIIGIAHFAITEYNKRGEGAKLEFMKVIKGELEFVQGINYRLILSANDGSASNNYEALVLDEPVKYSRNLISFKPLHA